MMDISRVWALLKRNERLALSGIALIEVFFWPFVDLVVWGFASRSFATGADAQNASAILLASVLIWRLALRCCFAISLLLINEFNSRGFVNLFASPVTMSEWMAGAMLQGLIDAFLVSIFSIFVIWFLYSIWIPSYGPLLLLFAVPLLVSGWSIGTVSAALLLHHGVYAQRLVWLTPWVFVPFSGVYYPAAVLPYWAAYIAHCLPMSHALEGLAIFITNHTISWRHLALSYGLAALYLSVALGVFFLVFHQSKVRGLARLEE